MAQLTADDRQFLKDAFQATADAPLEPDDPRYVSLSDVRGESVVELLARGIEFSEGGSVQFVCGLPGSGVTTTLKRLQSRLRGVKSHVEHWDPKIIVTSLAGVLLGLQKQKKGTVIVVDEFLHLKNLVEDIDALSNRPIHVVYSVPWTVKLDTALRVRLERLGPIYTIPSITIRDIEGDAVGEGLDTSTRLLAKRVDLQRLFGNEAACTKLLSASGGNPRDCLRLVQEVIRRANSLPVEDKIINAAIAHLQNGRLPIPNEAIPFLSRILRTHQVTLEGESVETVQSWVSAGFFLQYRNGREWYDVHPLIRPQVLKQAADIEARILAGSASAVLHAPAKQERSRRLAIDPSKLAIGLHSLRLAHIRLFQDLTLDFRRDGSPRQFTLILAENGHGKTTVLQAIALSASGVAGANLLAGNAAAFLDRRFQPANKEERCCIEAHFDALKTELHAPPTWKEFAGKSDPSLDQIRAQDIPQWFVAGYGTGRMLPRSRASKEPGRRAVDRLRSLFEAEPLVATGFADILADLLGRSVANEYAEMLRLVLVGNGDMPGLLPHDEQLHVEALELRGSGSIRESTDLVDADRFVLRLGEHRLNLPASWLSAGYQSTIAWVADLLGQVTLEAGRVLHPHEIAGIVLIDEIDLHLHPHWQASLVPSLRAIFPKVQFIATTHSPMVLPGLRQDEIIMLSLDEQGNIQQRPAPVAPALKTGSEILEWFFGIDKLYPAKLGQTLQEYTRLATDSERTAEEDARMQKLRQELQAADADPGWEPVERNHVEG